MSLARDGVCQATAVYFSKIEGEAAVDLPEEAAELLVGIGATEADLHTRVATLEMIETELSPAETFGSAFHNIGALCESNLAACTTDYELTVLLAVEIEKNVTLNETGFETVGSDEALLFVDSEEDRDRTVNERVVKKDSHTGGAAHAVVGAESGAVSLHPIAIHDSGDRVVEEVMHLVAALFSHHVLVTLKDDAGCVFVARSSRFCHHDVADLIGADGYIVFRRPVHEEVLHLVEMVGRTGNFCYLIEAFPQKLRLQICNLHVVWSLWILS